MLTGGFKSDTLENISRKDRGWLQTYGWIDEIRTLLSHTGEIKIGLDSNSTDKNITGKRL